jgi:serine/threonine protein kinase
VQHPGIVKIFDFGVLRDETVYIMMEFLEGESLWDRQVRIVHRQGGRVPAPDVLRLTRLIASSLAAAHEKRILHRDLKPENIIIVPDPDVPGGERTKVLDFGIARFMDSAQRRTVAGMVMGTAMYMAPEQCRGADHLDGKVDVYALGCILYELLAGKPPFEGDPNKVMVMQVTQAPRPLWEQVPGLPEQVHRLVHAMLAKKPDERPAMAEVVSRLQQLEGSVSQPALQVSSPHSATVSLEQLKTSAAPPGGSTQMLGATDGPDRGLPRSLLLGLAALALVLCGIALWGWLRSPPAAQPGSAPVEQRVPAAPAPAAAAPAAHAAPAPATVAPDDEDTSGGRHRRGKKRHSRRH